MQREFKMIIYVITAFLHKSAAYIEGPEREENSLILETLQPLDYSLLFDVPMESEELLFIGTAVIRLKCVKPTKKIILNTKDLMVDEGGVYVAQEVPDYLIPMNMSKTPEFDTGKQRLIITLTRELKIDEKIQVKVKYYRLADTSQHPDVAVLKYSYSRNADDKDKWIAVTIPGAVNGRRLYPCIDEPGEKTKFHVKVKCDEDMKCLTNSWMVNDQANWNTAENPEIDFESSYHALPLSTFSTGFVIGDFRLRQHIDEFTGIVIQIWSDQAVIQQLDFAGETAVKIFKFYKEHFHSVPAERRINVVALPYYGHTNKWIYGLIILEESLITNGNPSTQVREIETAFTLCDAFCHQYFGPQTTFKTWSENWLFMGLALFYRIPCMQHIFPTQATVITNRHLVESFIRVSSVNAEIKSRPVMVPDSRIDLTNLFQDTALAGKAYFLVRMMNYFLGKGVLSEQVKNYIAGFTFRISSLDNLWTKFPLGDKNIKLLSEYVTLKAIMDSWTWKEGLAHVKLTRNRKEKFVTIKQEFAENRYNHRIVPLNFITKSESVQKSATKHRATKKLDKNSETARTSEAMKKSNEEETVQYWLQSEPIRIPVEMNDWIILNTRLNVLCRIEYDPITLKLLRKTLMNKNSYEIIDVMSRTKFISDLFASVEVGKLSYLTLLKFTRYLKHEKSHFPIMVALHEFNRIPIQQFGTELFSKFQEYVQEIIKAIIRRNKFNIRDISEDNYEQYYFKKLIFTSACTFQVKECVDLSKAHFAKLIENGHLSRQIDPIPEALREPLYCQAIRGGGDLEWDFLNIFYSGKHWESLNDIILNALACTTDGFKMREYLEKTLDPEKIAPEDVLKVYQNAVSSKNGYTSMKHFFSNNVEEISQLNNNDPSRVWRGLEMLYENTWNQEDFTELEGFTAFDVPQQDIETFLEDSKQIARKNILWLKNMKVDISKFFEEKKIGNRLKRALTLT